MQKYLLLSILLLPTWALVAQQQVSVGPGYSNETYYSLREGTVASAPIAAWDLAFQISGFAASIRVNHGNGVLVYQVPGVSAADWATIDTAGITAWDQSFDSDESWDLGALNRGYSETNPFDLGWGLYNQITHVVSAKAIFVVVLSDGTHKKLRIDQLASGVYQFTFANLDGSDELTRTLSKSDFAGKNFGYFSIANDTLIDQEPLSDEWDLVFHKYLGQLSPGLYYGVTGVQTNTGLAVAELRAVDLSSVSMTDTAQVGFSTSISTIGFDWKSFNMNTFTWEIADSLTYFVRDREGEVFQLTFTDFGGSATGNFFFNLTNVTTSLDVGNEAIQRLGIFPNPASTEVNVLFETSKSELVTLSIQDLQGRNLRREVLGQVNGFQQIQMSGLSLPAGIYLLHVDTETTRTSRKLVIR